MQFDSKLFDSCSTNTPSCAYYKENFLSRSAINDGGKPFQQIPQLSFKRQV